MNQSFFRKQVTAQQGEKLLGDLIISQPVSYWLITSFLTAVTLIALFFLIANDYHRKQAVFGYLVPNKGIVTIFPPLDGLLSEIQVQQNDVIAQGEVLFEIQVDRVISANTYLTESVLNSIAQQESNLKQKINLEIQNFENLNSLNESKKQSIDLELEQLHSLFNTEKSLLEIKINAQQRAAILHNKGLLSSADFDQVKSTLLRQKNVLQQLNLQINETKFELLLLHSEKQSFVIKNKTEVNKIENDLAEIYKQQARLHAQNSNQVVSPVAGRISSINISPGQMVNAQQEVLALIPEGSELQAELYIPSRAIAFLSEKQLVNIRYDGFPYQKFGVQKAYIISISKSAVLPADLPVALTFNEPVYLVIASLAKQSVRAFGDEVELKAGMLLSADVLLERRSLFEWLLEPLFSIKGRD